MRRAGRAQLAYEPSKTLPYSTRIFLILTGSHPGHLQRRISPASTVHQTKPGRVVDLPRQRTTEQPSRNKPSGFSQNHRWNALAFLAMNQVFGKFFDVLDVEAGELQAVQERKGEVPFIFDVQTHYVSSSFKEPWKKGLLGLRRRARDMGVIWQAFQRQRHHGRLKLGKLHQRSLLDSDTPSGSSARHRAPISGKPSSRQKK